MHDEVYTAVTTTTLEVTEEKKKGSTKSQLVFW